MKNYDKTRLLKEKRKDNKEYYYFDRSMNKKRNLLPDYLNNEIDNVYQCSNLKLKIDKLMNYYFLKTESKVNLDIDKNVLNRINNNYLIDYVATINHELLSFNAKTDRIVVGLGTESLRELGITLHHIYGIPYIPGQGIKGTFRNYIINQYYNSEDKAVENELFTFIFGSNSQKGKVNFYDAFPTNVKDIMGLDIMTPHYNEYYQNKCLPRDNDKLSPNKFIIVKDANFKFNISIEKTSKLFAVKDTDSDKQINIGDWILKNFNYALKYQGIGSKTSVGYGFFSIDSLIRTNNNNKSDLIKDNVTKLSKANECKKDDMLKDDLMIEIEKRKEFSLGDKFNYFFDIYYDLNDDDKKILKNEMNKVLRKTDLKKLKNKNKTKYDKFRNI